MEGLLYLIGVLLVVGLPVAVVLGLVGFFRSMRLVAEVRELRAVVQKLVERAAGEAPSSAPSATRSEAATQPAPSPSLSTASAPVSPSVKAPEPTRGVSPRVAALDGAEAPGLGRLERALAGNWLLWIAGILLALGGLFIVAVAIEAGWFGPAARCFVGALAGVAMILAGERLGRSGLVASGQRRSAAPAMAAGAGVVTLYGSVYAAFGLYDLLPAPLAFAALAAISAGAAVLAWRYGPALVVLGLIGANLAPALIGSDTSSALALFGYVFAVLVGGLAVTRLVGARWPALVAIAGGAIWALIWIAIEGGRDAIVLAAFLPAMAAAAGAFAWRDAEARLDAVLARPRAASRALASLLAAYVAMGAAALILVHLLVGGGYDPAGLAGLLVLGGLAGFGAWRREAFSLTPFIALGGAALALYLWPGQPHIVTDTGIAPGQRWFGEPARAPVFAFWSFLYAGAFGLLGLILDGRAKLKAPFAALTFLAPLLALAIAYWRWNGFDQDARWSLAAVVLAALALGRLEYQKSRTAGGLDAAPGAASAYAASAAGAAAMAVGMALDQLWMSLGFALQAFVAAVLHQRFRLAALQWVAAGFAVLATARLTLFGEVFDYDVGAIPIFNWLLLGYGGAAAALWFAARRFERDGVARSARLIQGLETGAMILGVALISLQIRHALNGGDLRAAYLDDLVEVALQTSAWLAVALAIRLRLAPGLTFAPRWTERVLIALATLQVIMAHIFTVNPWWGFEPAPVEGPPIVNALALAYALPAVLAAAYALVARAHGARRLATAAGLSGAALSFVWVTLEVRRTFHAPNLSFDVFERPGAGAVTDAEMWAYSFAWLIYAAVLLALGFRRQRPSLRYAALAVLALTTLKVFIWDMAGLPGLLRAFSVIGLGGALLGLGVLYQRAVATNAKD